MARSQKSDDQYSDEEAERRLVAALRGSRITGHKPMKEAEKQGPKAACNQGLQPKKS